jgi:hypothetical protein
MATWKAQGEVMSYLEELFSVAGKKAPGRR